MGGLASPKGAGRAAGRVFQQEPPGGAAAPSQEPGGTRVVPRPVGLSPWGAAGEAKDSRAQQIRGSRSGPGRMNQYLGQPSKVIPESSRFHFSSPDKR